MLWVTLGHTVGGCSRLAGDASRKVSGHVLTSPAHIKGGRGQSVCMKTNTPQLVVCVWGGGWVRGGGAFVSCIATRAA